MFCCDKRVFVAAKEVFCHDESMIVTTNLFCQTYFCRDKTYVATNIILMQLKFCHDKLIFVVTKCVFCCDKSMLVATKLLLQQTCVCHSVYVTKLLSRQSHFTPTLVAAPANDRFTISSEGLL